MAGFDPATFIAGPAIVTFDSGVYYTQGNITVRSRVETFNIETSMAGKIDERLKSKSYEISFTPCGQINATLLGKMFPYGVANVGAGIFGAVDKTLVIHTLGGVVHTYSRAALTKSPGIRLSAGATAFTEMTFLALLKTSTEYSTEAAFSAVTAAALSDANFSEAQIFTPGYTAAYGTSPYAAMESQNGFQVDIGYEFTEGRVDRYGLVQMRLKSITAGARFTPIGLTEAQWDTLVLPDGSGAVLPGESLSKAGTDLVISKAATHLKVTIYDAGIKDHGLSFGDDPRLGELTFTSKRTWAVGVASNLFLIEIQAA
jgi:hypothetical protein